MRRHRIVLYNPVAPFFTLPLQFLALASVLDPARYEVVINEGGADFSTGGQGEMTFVKS